MTRNSLPFLAKGRGALSNRAGRFETLSTEPFEDGWWPQDTPPPLRTQVEDDPAKSVITRNQSADVPFDRSINPYRGCEHGCIYCFARPTHAYLGLSPGLDFEQRLFAKSDAPKRLEQELRRRGYRPQPIMLGTATDPYQPIEKARRITRGILSVLADFRHPLAIATKSALVTRDIDILAPMAEQRLVSVGISLTTLDGRLARIMEPRASSPARRLAAISALRDAGVPVTVMAAPMIPFVNDHELDALLEAGATAGATAASYVLLRLPLELKELFREWLQQHFPDRAHRVLSRLQECHGGILYQSAFETRMRGTGPYAELLQKRFTHACRRNGLHAGAAMGQSLDCTRFRVPDAPQAAAQLTLF